jgi:hypothetical protein
MPTNTILTPTIITNELLMRFKNNLVFTSNVSHEYDDRFAQNGARIGDTLKLRRPVQFTASNGATLSAQDVTETSVDLVINTQKHVAFEFTSKDLTLSIDRFADRYLNSAAVALANTVDVDGLTMAYQSTANAVGTPATVPNAILTYLQAGQKISENSAPVDDERHVVINPGMQSTIVDALKGLFQSSSEIDKQYKKGSMGQAAGFKWYMDQNIRTHTVGPLGGTPLVNGASQTGTSLITDGWTAAAASRLKKGDVFTIAGVNSVNRVSGDSTGSLQQFVVTADVSSDGSGNATIPIYPAITATGAYKTVTASPADNAAITVLGAAAAVSPQGIAFHKEAFCFAMAPLQVPQGVHMAKAVTDPETGMSIRMVSAYDVTNDKFITRADIMYGWAARKPEWACRVAS